MSAGERVGMSDDFGDTGARLDDQGQGTAADGFKRALVIMHPELQRVGARIVLTVHDEVLVESPVEHADKVASVMESCMRCGMSEFTPTVPIVVKVKIGTRWSETTPRESVGGAMNASVTAQSDATSC